MHIIHIHAGWVGGSNAGGCPKCTLYTLIVSYTYIVHTGGRWSLSQKDYLNQRGARVSCATFHRPTGLLVAGLTSGLFDLYQLPGFENIQVGPVRHVFCSIGVRTSPVSGYVERFLCVCLLYVFVAQLV